MPQAQAGALAPGLCGGQAARVTVWNTEASRFWDGREPQSFWGSAISDEIELGKSKFLFVPFCGDHFMWGQKTE